MSTQPPIPSDPQGKGPAPDQRPEVREAGIGRPPKTRAPEAAPEPKGGKAAT